MNRLTIVRNVLLAAVTAAALLATPNSAEAQERTSIGSTTRSASLAGVALSASQENVGPVATPVGIVRAEAAPEAVHLQNAGPNNRNVVWMVVGAGMLVGGSIIGDDVGSLVSVAGLVIGLVGLVRFLQ